MSETFTERLQPALRKWQAARDSHGTVFDPFVPPGTCKCGWKWSGKGRSPRRSLGARVAAAEKRADKVYEADADALIAQMRREAAQR